MGTREICDASKESAVRSDFVDSPIANGSPSPSI